QVNDDVSDDVDDDVADVVADADVVPTPPLPTPATTPPHQQELIPSTSQVAPTPPPSSHQSPIAPPSSPPQEQQPSQPLQITDISMNLLNTLLETCTNLTRRVENLEQDKIAQALEITRLKQRVRKLDKMTKLKASRLTRLRKVGTTQRVESSADNGRLEESQEQVYHIDLEHANKMLSIQDDEVEPAKLAPSAARRRKGVVIRDPEETTTLSVIVHSKPKSKDKGKGILVEEPKPLKKQAQIEQDEAYARELEDELNANINWNEVIEHHFNSIVAFLEKGEKELEEVASKAIKRKNGTHQLFLSFICLLRNFDREDLEMLWKIVQERFASSEPKNFSDDFLLNTLKTMFEKPNVEAYVWKSQRGSYGLAKVKRWKLIDFRVDAVEDYKEYTLRDYYCWLKTYYCWYKLKLLDDAVGPRLRLPEESDAADEKMKILL
nr:hypothetical protein [Tanacetum cinerariifolium]